MKSMWLSIIIPVYNVEKYIRRCLDSIVRENASVLSKLEVIVVDDGTPDCSGEIADEYALRYPFIRVIHKKNAGVAAARNTALEIASGDWVYFMDSDDWLAEGALEKIASRMNETELPGKISSKTKMEHEWQQVDMILLDAWQNRDTEETPWEHFPKEMLFDADEIEGLRLGALYFPMCSPKTNIPLAAPWDKLYRRTFLLENNLHFQESLKVLDDMIFNMECFTEAKKVVYLKEKIYHYRYVPNSITNSYKKNRVEQDEMVWDFIAGYMKRRRSFPKDNSIEERSEVEFLQAFYLRVIKSFSICCRLCFFHKDNEKSLKEKIRYVKEVANTGWYKEAFQKVRPANAEWKLKVMITVVRMHWWRGVYFLNRLANG